LYSGEQFDSKIGQQYLRQRYYNPVTGRFNRLDPFFGVQLEPLSFHKYLYAHDDPQNNTDPNGEFLPVLLAAFAIGGVIGGGAYLAGCWWANTKVDYAKLGLYSAAGGVAGVAGAFSFVYALALAEYLSFSQLGSLFVASSVSGIIGGATDGLIIGTGNSYLESGEFYQSFYEGLLQARIEAGVGGVLGGILAPGVYVVGGVAKVFSTRSATGAKACLDAERQAGNISKAQFEALDSRLAEFTRREKEAEKALQNYQHQNGPESHFYSKHGAQIEMYEQRIRANTGLAPDGTWPNKTVDSSRFISHQDQLEAYNIAKNIGYSDTYDMKRIIGEGFLKDSNITFTTTKIRFVFKDGQLITIYPIK
jgi:RHS repeat-associated protein